MALLQRALPHLTHEDICWRLHYAIKISQETSWDASRLAILSKGACSGDDSDEALARGVAFAEAAFKAPAFTPATKPGRQQRTKGKRQPK